MDTIYDVIIIGSGPAGLTAAIYTTRAGLKTLIIAGAKWGGQLQLTSEVENFPGFPEGILGPDLMSNMRKQAEHHGAEIVDVNFTRLHLPSAKADGGQVEGDDNDRLFTAETPEKKYQGRSIIIATGADTKWLGVKGEMERVGRGISTCAPCDGPFFRNKNIIVVGGGDSAMEEAIVMTKYAAHVTLIHRGDAFRASQIMQDKVFANEKITVLFNTVIEEILGENKVQSVKLKSPLSVIPNSLRDLPENTEMLKQVQHDNENVTWEMPIDGIFVAIGHIPNTKVFSAQGGSTSGGNGIELDEKGFIKVRDHFHTNIEGVFTAGDVHDKQYKQAITAAGFGCAAALEAEKWLDLQKTS